LAVVVLLSLAQFGPSPVRGETAQAASPIFGVTIPPGCRDWKMISAGTGIELCR
jgi:hypothetical protein